MSGGDESGAVGEAAASEGANAGVAVADEILTFARARGAALARKNRAAVEAQLAPDFVYTNSQGESFSAEAYLAWLRSDVLEWDEQRLEDATVHLVGLGRGRANTVILVCTVVDVGRYEGEAFVGRSRSTQILRAGAGAPWRNAAGHTSRNVTAPRRVLPHCRLP